MRSVQRIDQYLRLRGGTWYYVRRVPKSLRHVEDRKFINQSLQTDSLTTARQRRDVCAAADNQRWAEITPQRFDESPRDANQKDMNQRAEAYGFTYRPAVELAEKTSLAELIERLKAVVPSETPMTPKVQRDTDALLGLAEPDVVTITQAMDLYLSEIALDELSGKSPEQVANYSKVKRRAIGNFVRMNGDMNMREIEREHGRKVYQHWAARVHPTDGSKPMSGNSANRDLGNLRKLYRRYFEYIGEEARQNPFRNLRFSDAKLNDVKPFSSDWVQARIFEPSVLEGLNREAALLCFALIETGCRPSELSNILPENICLDAEVPHIRIRSTKARQLKSKASIRDVPLVGVSLEAMKLARNGFPHYRERGYLLSQSLTKAFKARKLFPSENHRIYSFRHSFENRMLEAGIDFGLRCTLMGHRNPRPEYGDGGSLIYRRAEMLKIVHQVNDGLLQGFPFNS
jgi:site-specific recombinase XerD